MRDYRPEIRSVSLAPGDDRSITFYPAIRSHIFIWGIIPALLAGAAMTLLLTVIAVGDGIIIGTLVGIGRVIHNRILRTICGAYVDFFRGTPLLVQIFMIHFGLPPVLGRLLHRAEPVPLDPFLSAIVALSINSGAYVAEIVRAGIQSIDKGQMEAARSLGMTYGQAMRLVILPQAMKRIIPPLGNEFIAMLKDSSLVSIIGMEELVRKGQIIVTRSYRPEDTWFTVGLVFLFMTLPFTRLVAYLERRLRTGDQA
ncbi:MAG: amino acid ABC transporter permease [Firmicutes bacterium]|nr:amino acid ABC transporter permease [Bacillota bacterium]